MQSQETHRSVWCMCVFAYRTNFFSMCLSLGWLRGCHGETLTQEISLNSSLRSGCHGNIGTVNEQCVVMSQLWLKTVLSHTSVHQRHSMQSSPLNHSQKKIKWWMCRRRQKGTEVALVYMCFTLMRLERSYLTSGIWLISHSNVAMTVRQSEMEDWLIRTCAAWTEKKDDMHQRGRNVFERVSLHVWCDVSMRVLVHIIGCWLYSG